MIIENQHIELKRDLTDEVDLEKEVIAFLNTREGGKIYIGIDNTGSVIGVEDSDKLILKIKDRIKNNIAPLAMGLFDVIEEEYQNKKVIKIIVAGGNEKPYYKKNMGRLQKALTFEWAQLQNKCIRIRLKNYFHLAQEIQLVK